LSQIAENVLYICTTEEITLLPQAHRLLIDPSILERSKRALQHPNVRNHCNVHSMNPLQLAKLLHVTMPRLYEGKGEVPWSDVAEVCIDKFLAAPFDSNDDNLIIV
jgi:hypothetical protein